MSKVRKLLASAKIDAMLDVVKMTEDDGEPLVVFSKWPDSANVQQDFVDRREWPDTSVSYSRMSSDFACW